MRDAVHDNFDRDCDLLFNLFTGAARPLSNHLDVVVCHIGVGFHGKVLERNCAPCQQQDAYRNHQELVSQGVIDKCANHMRPLCGKLLLALGVEGERIVHHLLPWRKPGRDLLEFTGDLSEPPATLPPVTSVRRKVPGSAGTKTQSRSWRWSTAPEGTMA